MFLATESFAEQLTERKQFKCNIISISGEHIWSQKFSKTKITFIEIPSLQDELWRQRDLGHFSLDLKVCSLLCFTDKHAYLIDWMWEETFGQKFMLDETTLYKDNSLALSLG